MGFSPSSTTYSRRSRERLLLAVLTVCPTPAKIATVPVEEFVHRVQQAFPGDHLLTKKLHAIHTEAQCSASVAAGASAVATEVRHTVQQVRLFQGQITVWESRLATVTATFPESRFLLSIPWCRPPDRRRSPGGTWRTDWLCQGQATGGNGGHEPHQVRIGWQTIAPQPHEQEGTLVPALVPVDGLGEPAEA